MPASSPSPRPAPGSVECPVLAAGVVLWCGTAAEPHFLLLKNRRHGSWGLAKGHLDAGEGLVAGALREVAEETGYRLGEADLLEGFSDTQLYRVEGSHAEEGGQPAWKRVVYYLATAPVADDALRCSEEHAEHAWLSLEDALARVAFPALRRTLLRAADSLALLPAAS